MVETIPKGVFKFKQFEVAQDSCPMKIGTDGVLLGAWVNVDGAKHVLDIGTGTGIIALMIAQRTEEANIVALDVDQDSCEQASANFKNSPWETRLRAGHQSVQEYSKFSTDTFDLIVCNPPFFTGGTISKSQPKNIVRHTIKLPHGELLRSVSRLLSPEGRFAVILPYIEGLRFIEIAANYNLFANKITEVNPNEGKPIERLLIDFSKNQSAVVQDALVIEKERHKYTEEYIALTSAFYLKM